MFLESCGVLDRERVECASPAPSLMLIDFNFNRGDDEVSVMVPFGQTFDFFWLRRAPHT